MVIMNRFIKEIVETVMLMMAIFFGMGVLSSEVQAQAPAKGPTGSFQVPVDGQGGDAVINGDNIFSNAFSEFQKATKKWYPIMKSAASRLFWGLAVISMIWTFGQLALGGADFGRFFSEAIKYFVYIGFNWFLLDKAGPNVGELGRMVFDTFAQLGSQASNYHHDIMDPGVMFSRGFDLFMKCNEAAKGLGWRDVGQYLALCSLAYAILILAAIISINVFMVMVSYWFVSIAGIFILGFGGTKWTWDMAIGYYKSLLGIGLQLLGMVLVIDVGDRILNTYILSLNVAGIKTQSLGVIIVVLFCIFKISSTIPGLLASMLHGGSATGVANTGGGVLGTAASVGMGLLTAGAGLGAMGGAKGLSMLGGGAGEAATGGGGAGEAAAGGSGGPGGGFLSAFQSSASSGDNAKQLAKSVPDLGAGGGSQVSGTTESPSRKGDDSFDGGAEGGDAPVDASNDGDSSTAGGVDVSDSGSTDASNDGKDTTAGGVDVGGANGSGGGGNGPAGMLSAGSGIGSGVGAVKGSGSAGKAKGGGTAKGGGKDNGGMTDAQKKMHSIGQAMFQKGSKQAMAAVMGHQAAEAIGMSADALGASADAAWEKIKERRAGGDGKVPSSSGAPGNIPDSKGSSGGADSDPGISGRHGGSDAVGGAPGSEGASLDTASGVGESSGVTDGSSASATSGGEAGSSSVPPSAAAAPSGPAPSSISKSNQQSIATLENSARQAAARGDTASAAAFTAMAKTASDVSARGQSITSGPGLAQVESAGDQAWQQAKAKAAPGPAPSAGPGHSAPSASPAAPGAAPRPSAAPGPAPSPGPAPAPSAAPAGAPGPAPSAGPGHSAPSASPAAPPPPPPPVAEEPPPWDGSWDGSMGGEEPPPWTDDDF